MDITKKEAIAAYGTQQALADALKISRTAVTMWSDDRPIPNEHALRLRYELRPDLFSGAGTLKPTVRPGKQIAGNVSSHGAVASRKASTPTSTRVKGKKGEAAHG